MYFACRSFIGKGTPQNWSQFWENEPDEPSLAVRRGHLFGLISASIPSESQQQINILGHQFIDFINQEYFSPAENPPQAQLLSAVNKLLAQYKSELASLTLILAVSL